MKHKKPMPKTDMCKIFMCDKQGDRYCCAYCRMFSVCRKGDEAHPQAV